MRKKHGKTSLRVAGKCQLAKNIQNRAYLSIKIHKYNNKNISIVPLEQTTSNQPPIHTVYTHNLRKLSTSNSPTKPTFQCLTASPLSGTDIISDNI
jgi:predicted HTH transcriptional regulator